MKPLIKSRSTGSANARIPREANRRIGPSTVSAVVTASLNVGDVDDQTEGSRVVGLSGRVKLLLINFFRTTTSVHGLGYIVQVGVHFVERWVPLRHFIRIFYRLFFKFEWFAHFQDHLDILHWNRNFRGSVFESTGVVSVSVVTHSHRHGQKQVLLEYEFPECNSVPAQDN